MFVYLCLFGLLFYVRVSAAFCVQDTNRLCYISVAACAYSLAFRRKKRVCKKVGLEIMGQ